MNEKAGKQGIFVIPSERSNLFGVHLSEECGSALQRPE
jgi:hypothetical protein